MRMTFQISKGGGGGMNCILASNAQDNYTI